MARALRVVGQIAGAVALVTRFIPGLQPIAAFAAGISAVASIGAQLTAPRPIARGSPAQLIIDVEPPRPCIVGQVMTGGVLRHDVAYGAPVARVPNPYRWQVRVLSGVSGIQGVVSEHFDFGPITRFYSGFYATTQNLGQRPQTTALVPPYGAAPGWNSTSKLSRHAHVGLNFLFDRNGRVFASGLPTYTALCDGEKVYDPRLDSTFPGGSGPCRAGVEGTYVYNRNPACWALTYALGWFEGGQRIFGLGQPVDTIDLPAIVDWANDCDANGWTVNMVLQEGGTGANLREQRVRNLDNLCAAGGGRWYQAGGLLSFDWHRPRLSLATLTDDDILLAGGGTDAVQTVRERMNGVRPQYVSPSHNWQQITAAEIVGSTYRAEDGVPLTQVWPLNGVTNPEQAGELAAYAMADSRELGPMDLVVKAAWRFYRPGDCITIDSSLAAYEGQAVINQRSLNPQTLDVSLSLKSETPAKHDFALGKVADPPPTPVLKQTPEERDVLAAATLAARASDVADVVAPANANRVPFSRFEGGQGWFTLGDFNPPAFLTVFDARYFICAEPTFTAANQNVFLVNAPLMPVLAGETLSISARVQAFALPGGLNPNYWHLYWEYYSSLNAGTQIGIITIGQGFTSISEGVRHAAFSTVPAGAKAARLVLRYKSAGAGKVRLAILEPMVASAAAGQTVHPPYAPGPNASDGADPNSLITVDGSGVLSGIGTVGIPVDNRNVPLGNANRVPFSRFEGGQGWASAGDVLGVPALIVYDGRYNIASDVAFASAGQSSFLFNSPRFPVVEGERFSVSSIVQVAPVSGPAPSFWQLYIEYYTSAGSIAGSTQIAFGTTTESYSQRFSGFSSAPANARSARLALQASSAGAGTMRLLILEPMVASAAAGQTVHPPYTPGPNGVDGATRNTGALNADGLNTANLGGPLFVGRLPPSRAEAGLINANVALGSNAVVNSDFTRGKFGWRWGGGGFESEWGTNLPDWFGQRNVMWARVPGVFASGSNRDLSPDALWAGGTLANAPLFALAVNDADRLFAGVLAATHRCVFQLWILVFDGAGTLIQAEEATGGREYGSGGGDPANFNRVTRFTDVPTGGRWAIPMMRLLGNGGTEPYIFFTEPMLAKVPSGQTGIPRYTPGRADTLANPTTDITVGSDGVMNNIGTASINVDNRRAALQGLASARPASGQFVGQEYHANDTSEISQWDGFNWRVSADITTMAQRSIEPQFPSIEIKQGESGHTGNRTVTHAALRATTALTGGTWSLPAQSLGAGSASINSSTGTVTLSSIVQSGSYTVRYTHTDGTPTDRAVPVIYVPTPPSGVVSAKTGRASTTGGTAGGGGWETILTLPLTDAPEGRVSFGGVEGLSFLFPTTGSGTADYEARLQVNGVTLTHVGTQNVVTGGAINFVSFSDLFVGSYPVSAGTLTFTIDLRPTSGRGTIDTTNTALEATVIAS